MIRHDWNQILKDFERSNLSVPKYAKKHKISATSLYQKLKERSKNSSHQLILSNEGVHEITLNQTTVKEVTKDPIFQIKFENLHLEFYDLPNPHWLAEVLKECH